MMDNWPLRYDCSLMDCPIGDDPGTYEDHVEVQLLQCVANGGNFSLSFRQVDVCMYVSVCTEVYVYKCMYISVWMYVWLRRLLRGYCLTRRRLWTSRPPCQL